MPTLNGRKDPAPHPGVDLATLRFARPTPTESPSTASGLAGFPESSPQQIAPDTPATSGVLAASLLRAPGPWNHVIGSASVVGRVSAVQNVGTVSAKKILKAHDSLLRESASALRRSPRRIPCRAGLARRHQPAILGPHTPAAGLTPGRRQGKPADRSSKINKLHGIGSLQLIAERALAGLKTIT